jgi:HK97 family phage prohead protease
MTPIERRTIVEGVEFRAADGRLVAAGYASAFNRLSQNLGGFVEQVAPGAFTKTIQEQDVRALFNHDENALLGRLSAGTLRLAEDGTGLGYEIDLPDTTVGRDVAKLLERKDVSGSSFGFRTVEDDWSETENGFPLRTLKAVSLRDVGPVTFPAYTDSTSALRSLAEARSLDPQAVVEAAARGELRDLLHAETDGRETPTVVHRRPSHWFI